MRTIKEVLGFNIRRLRGSRTQEQMAEFLGMNLRTYQRLEKGNRPQKATMKRVLERLKVPEASLFQTTGLAIATPTVEQLTAVIQDQERRIRELETALAERVQELKAAIERSSPDAAGTTPNPSGVPHSPEREELLARLAALEDTEIRHLLASARAMTPDLELGSADARKKTR